MKIREQRCWFHKSGNEFVQSVSDYYGDIRRCSRVAPRLGALQLGTESRSDSATPWPME
jgi:hypothetical protein